MDIASIASARIMEPFNINALYGLNQGLPKTEPNTDKPGISFDSFLNAMVNMYKEADANITASEQFQLDVATGVTDDVVGLTLALDKATSSLNFTVQVTNRLLEAYREIMRIQV